MADATINRHIFLRITRNKHPAFLIAKSPYHHYSFTTQMALRSGIIRQYTSESPKLFFNGPITRSRAPAFPQWPIIPGISSKCHHSAAAMFPFHDILSVE